MQTIKPAKATLFCQPDEPETKTAGGILLDVKTANLPRTAVVINVGEGVTQFKSKDRIVYKSYATSDIKLNNVDYFLIAEEDVLGIVLEVDK